MTDRVRLVATLMGLLVVAGCESGGGTPAPAGTAAPVSSPSVTTSSPAAAPSSAGPAAPSCLRRFGPRVESQHEGSVSLPLYVMGHGPTVVVLSDQSEADPCEWVPLVAPLLRTPGHPYTVVAYDYFAGAVDDLTSVVRHERGARSVELVGASEGAKASLILASHDAHLAGVVSLSAEATEGDVVVASRVRHLTDPVLLVTAAHDPFQSTASTRTYDRIAPARDKSLVVVPGDQHGVDLLHGRVLARIRAFLLAHR